MDRRSFLEKASLGSTALVSNFNISNLLKDEKLKVGLIGAGWYGMVITEAALKVGGVEVIGVCDVDSDFLEKSVEQLEKLQGSRPKGFKDYRELLDQRGLQAIFIGTPPHWHALQFVAACEKGLDIYCEKPLSYDVMEGLAMISAAKRAGNIVQIGFQRRQGEAFKKTKQFISEGKAGQIHQIEAQIHYNPTLKDHTIQDPPPSLDWDAWCGPAPMLDYRPNIGHKSWRLEKEYGNGHLVDWGIHHIDIIRQIMDLGMPDLLEVKGGLLRLDGKITTPDTLNATMFFDGLPVRWQHRLWGTGALNKEYNNGVFFYGEEATIFTSDRKMVIMRNAKGAELEAHEISAATIREDHMAEFLTAVKSNNKNLLSSPIEDAFQSTATVQLAMIAYQAKTGIKWDAARHKIIDNKDASSLLARPYRNNYKRATS